MKFDSKLIGEPEFKNVVVVDSKLKKIISNAEIFNEIIAQSITIKDEEGLIESGDIVRYMVKTESESRTEQVTIGSRCYPKEENLLIGMRKGEKKSLERMEIEVVFVKRRHKKDISDETVKELNIPDVNTVSQYKNYYIREHGDKIRQSIVLQFSRSIQLQLLKQVQIQISKKDVEELFTSQKDELMRHFNNNEVEYIKVIRQNFGKTKKENAQECDELLKEQCETKLKEIILGMYFAQKEEQTDTKAIYEEYVKIASANSGIPEEQIKEQVTEETMLASYYLQALSDAIIEYYKPKVQLILES